MDFLLKTNETLREVLLEMWASDNPAIVRYGKRIAAATARDSYCQICGRILGHKPSEEWYDKELENKKVE